MCLCNQAVESGTGLMVVMPYRWKVICGPGEVTADYNWDCD